MLELPAGQEAKKPAAVNVLETFTKQSDFAIDQNHLKGRSRNLSFGAIYHKNGYGGYLLTEGSEYDGGHLTGPKTGNSQGQAVAVGAKLENNMKKKKVNAFRKLNEVEQFISRKKSFSCIW